MHRKCLAQCLAHTKYLSKGERLFSVSPIHPPFQFYKRGTRKLGQRWKNLLMSHRSLVVGHTAETAPRQYGESEPLAPQPVPRPAGSAHTPTGPCHLSVQQHLLAYPLFYGSVSAGTHSGLPTRQCRNKRGQNHCGLRGTFHTSPPFVLRTALQRTYDLMVQMRKLACGVPSCEHMNS